MKTAHLLSLTLLLFTLFNCKEESKEFTDYKYQEKGNVLNCENMDTKLFNEALFSFEEDMISYYSSRNNINGNELRAYSSFVREAVAGRLNYAEMVSPHTVKVFEALKGKQNIWNMNNAKSNLNYDSDFFKCLAENINNNDLKRTLKALLDTKSMSAKLFGAPLQTSFSQATRDKYLATYIAFDLYYAKLFDVDLSQVTQNANEGNNEPNEEAPLSDPHAGHNH